MTTSAAGFQFTNDRPQDDDATLVVRIPEGRNRKRRLLADYAAQLRLPGYFGWNWDAFEECLRDLTWLEGVRTVIVVHRDIPFAESPEHRDIYLSILQDRLSWSHPRCPRFQVIFPCSARSRLADKPPGAES